jgi:RNA recognition motif-containing protein
LIAAPFVRCWQSVNDYVHVSGGAILMTDRATGRARGFGFVAMSTEEEGQEAMNALNGTIWMAGTWW